MSLTKAIAYLKKDKTLKPLLEKYVVDELPASDQSLEQHLMRSIISQQLSTKAAATIYSRFVSLFPDGSIDMSYALKIDDDTYRSVGLSYQKAGYVKNVAHYFLNNAELPWATLTDDTIIEQLTKIKGVGQWTVEMILIFNLQRMDVLPLDDLIVKKGFCNILGIEESDKKAKSLITAHAENWRPYRTVASRLMWIAKDQFVNA